MMIAFGLLKTFWKPLAGILLALALYGAWVHHEGVVEQRGFGKGEISGIYKGTKAGYIKGHGAAIDERQAADDQQLAEAKTKARAAELALQDEFEKQSVKRQQEKVRYEQTLHDLRTAALAGNSGMRLPAGTCQGSAGVPGSSAPEGAAAASGPVDQDRGIALLPATSASVLDAASQLRQLVQDRNALIDKFNQCRAMANAP